MELIFADTVLFVDMFSSKLSQGFSCSCLMPRLNLDSSSSNFNTFTLISCPKVKTSDGLLILVQEISVMCTNPSKPPKSTKAP